MWRSFASLVLAVVVLGAFALAGRAALRSQAAQLGPSQGLSPAVWDVQRRPARAVCVRLYALQLVVSRDPRCPLTRE
jgi:hypothetical protein